MNIHRGKGEFYESHTNKSTRVRLAGRFFHSFREQISQCYVLNSSLKEEVQFPNSLHKSNKMLILKCPKVCTKKNTMERSHTCVQMAIFKIKYSKIIDD